VMEATADPDPGTSTWGKAHCRITFLRSEIYLRDVEPRLQTLTAFTRFSIRA
jgi:hypothetical protein